MEELGSDEKKFHINLGSEILIGENDLVILIGEKAAWFAEGLTTTGCAIIKLLFLEKWKMRFQLLKILKEQFFFWEILQIGKITSIGRLIMNWRMKRNAELSSTGRRIFWSSQMFQFISVRAILAGITALFFGFFLGPKLITLLRIWSKTSFQGQGRRGN